MATKVILIKLAKKGNGCEHDKCIAKSTHRAQIPNGTGFNLCKEHADRCRKTCTVLDEKKE